MSERTPMDLALKSLSRQAYSRAKLATRLGRAGFEEPQIDECLKRLENWGYLNDREYGIARIATLQKRLKSRNYVASDLEAQGLSPELIGQLLAEFYPEEMEIEIAWKLLKKKAGVAKKGLGLLARAGFSENTIQHCFPDRYPT